MQQIYDWQGKSDLKIGLASDHAGLEQKKAVLAYLGSNKSLEVKDLGPFEFEVGDDYPEYAAKLAREISRGNIDCGVLVCRSGLGMSMAANRHYGVRATMVDSVEDAAISRSHNASNVIVTRGHDTSEQHIQELLDEWLNTPFSQEERHLRRLRKVETESVMDLGLLYEQDPDVAATIDKEIKRQDEGLELIASENFTSPAVCAATGSLFTNKYAEGYPGKRYYHGCDNADEIESLAIERACNLFGAEAANVQVHSGSQANMAAYLALLAPGDTVLALSLDHGGHLTHGLKANFSGQFYNFIGYGVNAETETLDYDEIERLALEHQPKMLVGGASAYPREIDFERLRAIADKVGAYFVVDMAHIAGLVAAGVHPSPVPHTDITTTTTHKTLRGPRGGLVLAKEKHMKKINSRVFPGIQGGPLVHVIAAKAVCFKEAETEEFGQYQRQVVRNAQTLASELSDRGFRIVSGGTDNHLMLVDLRPKNITGKEAANALDAANITVNANLIPFDPEKATVTSGLRIGTPAVTTRGTTETEMKVLAEWITKVLENRDDEKVIQSVRDEVINLSRRFPLPQYRV